MRPAADALARRGKARLAESRMTPRERAELVLAFARVLYVNGQATEQIVAAAERLGTQLGLHAELQVRWGELELRVEDEGAKLICAVAAQPIRIDMGRVASTMQAIEELATGELTPHAAQEAIVAISKAPTSPTWLFALATATGGVALALLSGV